MIQKILTKREMINCQKFNFLLFLTINFVTTGARELNGIRQISLVTHNARDLDEISSGLAIMHFLYFKPILSAIFVTIVTGMLNKCQNFTLGLFFQQTNHKKLVKRNFQFWAPKGVKFALIELFIIKLVGCLFSCGSVE